MSLGKSHVIIGIFNSGFRRKISDEISRAALAAAIPGETFGGPIKPEPRLDVTQKQPVAIDFLLARSFRSDFNPK